MCKRKRFDVEAARRGEIPWLPVAGLKITFEHAQALGYPISMNTLRFWVVTGQVKAQTIPGKGEHPYWLIVWADVEDKIFLRGRHALQAQPPVKTGGILKQDTKLNI